MVQLRAMERVSGSSPHGMAKMLAFFCRPRTSLQKWVGQWLVCNLAVFQGRRVKEKEQKEDGKETWMILTGIVILELKGTAGLGQVWWTGLNLVSLLSSGVEACQRKVCADVKINSFMFAHSWFVIVQFIQFILGLLSLRWGSYWKPAFVEKNMLF